MKFWKTCGILLLLTLTVFFGYEFFFGGGGVVAASDTIDALKVEVAEKDALVSSLQFKLEMLEEQVKQAEAEGERAVLAYVEENERLEALLLSGAQAHKEGDAMYTYTVSGGKVTLTGYIGSEEKVSVPATIEGKPVVGIGKETFKETAVREIVLPETVTYIDWFAFYGCYGLNSITIPKSVTKIEYGVFDGCSSSLTIFCPKNSYAEKYAKSYGIRVSAE